MKRTSNSAPLRESITVHFGINLKPDGAATESSSNREGIDRNSSCQEFWNLEQKSQRFEIRDWTLERGDGTFKDG